MSIFTVNNGASKQVSRIGEVIAGSVKNGPFYTSVNSTQKQLLTDPIPSQIDHIEMALGPSSYYATYDDSSGSLKTGTTNWSSVLSDYSGKATITASGNSLRINGNSGWTIGIGSSIWAVFKNGDRYYIGNYENLNGKLAFSGSLTGSIGSSSGSPRSSACRVYLLNTSSTTQTQIGYMGIATSLPVTIASTYVYPTQSYNQRSLLMEFKNYHYSGSYSQLTLNATWDGTSIPVSFVNRMT